MQRRDDSELECASVTCAIIFESSCKGVVTKHELNPADLLSPSLK